ncbi:unnamed protein product [Penicillium roqueforti FM164]|uniref:Uncharacterized protein n=1 Tax=Penicillium roqueforti (strain FM164) TaxID=1365484 RepID=W6QHQ7_PENRF|nr:unnamed protein product [Penicillium roqueforti FM164]
MAYVAATDFASTNRRRAFVKGKRHGVSGSPLPTHMSKLQRGQSRVGQNETLTLKQKLN